MTVDFYDDFKLKSNLWSPCFMQKILQRCKGWDMENYNWVMYRWHGSAMTRHVGFFSSPPLLNYIILFSSSTAVEADTFVLLLYSVKRSDVTGNRFEWQLGENKVTWHPSPILHCISQLVENRSRLLSLTKLLIYRRTTSRVCECFQIAVIIVK